MALLCVKTFISCLLIFIENALFVCEQIKWTLSFTVTLLSNLHVMIIVFSVITYRSNQLLCLELSSV